MTDNVGRQCDSKMRSWGSETGRNEILRNPGEKKPNCC